MPSASRASSSTISGPASAQPDYSMVVRQEGTEYPKVTGTCIMYGGLDKKATESGATDGICERCLPFFLAQALEDVT